MIYSINYDVNYQLKMNDMVRKISNRAKLFLKNERSSDFLFDISRKSFRLLRGKDPLNLTKILICSHHILQALSW